MAIEMSSDGAICSKCGKKYSRRKGFFPVSYAILHKGIGYAPVCKDCIDTMYNTYLAQCNNAKGAVRQLCRKLDLYWSESVYEVVQRKSTTRSMMTQYIAKINTVTYAGKSYDDTLSEEGVLWNFSPGAIDIVESETVNVKPSESIETSEEIIAFWGSGYSDDMYEELEQRRRYWMSKFPEGTDLDVGTEALIRQICALELDINRDRFAGKPIDKSVNALNNLLGSANLKPTQQKNNADTSSLEKTPYGVWIHKLENERPISEPSEEMKDVDGIVKYISIWFLGHLCKMLGIKNTYCKLYEEEIEKMRVEHPEYEDEDDESVFNDIYGAESGEEEAL